MKIYRERYNLLHKEIEAIDQKLKITKYETQLNICTDNSNKVENAEELLNAQENKYTEKTKQNKKELEEAKEKNLDLKYEVERLKRENEECINIY